MVLGGWYWSRGPLVILTLHHLGWRNPSTFRRCLHLVLEFYLHFLRFAVEIDQVLNVLVLADHPTAFTWLVVSLILWVLFAALTEQIPDDFEILLPWLAFIEHMPVVTWHRSIVNAAWVVLLHLRSDSIIFKIFWYQGWPEILANLRTLLIDRQEQLELLALLDCWDQRKIL